MIHLDPNDGTPIYRQVIDQVSLMVMSGQYATGDQLESVSSLAARLKVNPMTVSKAYSHLVEMRVAERRPGRGIFVAAVDEKKAACARHDRVADTLIAAARLVAKLGVSTEEAVAIFSGELKRITRQQLQEEKKNP